LNGHGRSAGEWLKVNGEAIYGTRKWDNAPAVVAKTTHYFTKKGKDLYLIITKWQDKPLIIDGINRAENVSLLGYGGKVKYVVSGNKVTITPPSINPANNPCSYAWVFKMRNCIR
jgi:alpha-L-fucosidase